MEDSKIFDDPVVVEEYTISDPVGIVTVPIESATPVPVEELQIKDELVDSIERILDTKLTDKQTKVLTLAGSLLSDNKSYVKLMNDVSDILKIVQKWK